mmetsp:Transcript_48222/g.76714  ORF Transcript_48222/g.76714 Transcript_48222/m.76714 type:complete len:110 (-) Transcript_48222:92-421(-)
MTLNTRGLVGLQTSASFSETMSLITSCWEDPGSMKMGAKTSTDFSWQEQPYHPVGPQEAPYKRSLANHEVFFLVSRKSTLMCWELQGSRTTKDLSSSNFQFSSISTFGF